MATPEWYTGDTWPPLEGTAVDADDNVVDLSTADSLRMVAKPTQGSGTITGTALPKTTGVDGRWKYTWGALDLSVAGTYVPELEVTWDALSTPPKIQTFRTDSETFLVKPDND